MGEYKISGQTGVCSHLTFMLLPALGKSLLTATLSCPSNEQSNSCLKLLKGSKERMVIVVKDKGWHILFYFIF